ncbi:MAG: DUF2062 domain-containing protein [Bacteroidales bacterium]|nr:DUF2062 domain-containing protein [Bacteroidales bacterium]MBN2819830.1 DUF2062 domain-containing protein [Bacteroidales bacterium]
MIGAWFKRKVLVPIRVALKKGVSPKRLAVSLALGITIGVIPFYGLTTLLVGVIALALRLDIVIMQVVHYIVQPIQIALIIPFLKAGNFLFTKNSVDFTIKEYLAGFKSDFWVALGDFWKLNLSATLVWLIVAIPLSYLLYHAFVVSIRRFAPVLVRKHHDRVK